MPTLLLCKKDAKKSDQASYRKATDANGQLSYTGSESWIVVYDGVVSQNVAATAAGLPAIGSILGTVDGAPVTVSGVTPVRRAESPYVWDVHIDFASHSGGGSAVTNNWSITLNKGASPWEQTAYKDRLGLSLTNVMGDLLPQLPPEQHYDGTISISWTTKNVPTDHEADLGKVNSDTINVTICGINLSYGPRQLKLVGCPIQSVRTVVTVTGGGSPVPVNTYQYNCELQYTTRKDGYGPWQAPNEGWRGYATSSSTSVTEFMDAYHQKLSAPTKMDDQGVPLGPTDAIVYCPAALSTTAGRFEIEYQTAFSGHFTGLRDIDQIP